MPNKMTIGLHGLPEPHKSDINIHPCYEQRHLIFVDIWCDGKVVYLTYLSLGGMSTDSSIESISWRNALKYTSCVNDSKWNMHI